MDQRRPRQGAAEERPGGAAVPQQSGLGRGLAALLPGASGERTDATESLEGGMSGARPVAQLSAQLAEGLANTESGLGLIYRALDALVAEYALEDAAIVIEEPGLGRQVFRAG